MTPKTMSRAILAVVNELDNQFTSVERNGVRYRAVPEAIYLDLRSELLASSSHFEDLSDASDRSARSADHLDRAPKGSWWQRLLGL